MNSQNFLHQILALLVRAALLLTLVVACWLVYQKLPAGDSGSDARRAGETTVQIVLRRSDDIRALALDIPIDLSPVDIVAVRHEYFVEPRARQRFEEFLRDRMNGRAEVKTRLDAQGRASVQVPRGNWWLHAVLSGEVDLEWRLPLTITGDKQTIELTMDNAYSRSKSF